jgi:hypothetical protein
MIRYLNNLFWSLLLSLCFAANSFGLEVFDRGSSIEVLENFPLDISLSRLVANYHLTESFLMKGDALNYQAGVEAYQKGTSRLISHVLEEDLIHKVQSFLFEGDPLIRVGLAKFSELLVREMNEAASQGKLDLSRYSKAEKVLDAQDLFPDAGLYASYEYAYGRELKRQVLEEFEVIHRHTFMENYEHKIDIEVDFLDPIKKIISTLRLDGRFEWLYKQSLRYGYHAYFKHSKKVFTRSKGYYGKLRLTLELLRRKRRWWGSSDWEVVGRTIQIQEEPRALVATDARVLD